MSEIGSVVPRSELGTLVWIGDQLRPEFREAFQYCVSNVAQLAIRHDLDESLARPAAGVRRIVMERSTRALADERKMDRLQQMYPQASILHLLGTLCEGMRVPWQQASDAKLIAWHRWNQVLPEWLAPCGAVQESPSDCGHSVAILASTVSAGAPLMDLAESAGVTAVWCRNPDTLRVRNVDTVWWDDSVAQPTTSRRWRDRMSVFGGVNRRVKHAWIVSSPRYDQHSAAKKGGVDVVVSKPHRIECLLTMLASRRPARAADWDAKLRVA